MQTLAKQVVVLCETVVDNFEVQLVLQDWNDNLKFHHFIKFILMKGRKLKTTEVSGVSGFKNTRITSIRAAKQKVAEDVVKAFDAVEFERNVRF